MQTFGFIMTRHVCNNATNELWKESYRCIRKHYPNNIKIFPILDMKIKNLKILGLGKVFDRKSLNTLSEKGLLYFLST